MQVKQLQEKYILINLCLSSSAYTDEKQRYREKFLKQK